MKKVMVLALATLLGSCSFSGKFYQPDRLSSRLDVVRIPIKDSKDTMLLHFDGKDHIASFTDLDNVPKALSYDLETIWIESSSGNRLYSWFMRPKNATPKATVLFLHGNAGNVLSQVSLAMPLVKKGYQVLVLDYSGYGFSTGKPKRKKMVQDATSALQMLRKRPDVAGTKIILYGQSMGGQVASRTAELNEKDIDALVTEGAPSSHKDIAAAMFPILALPARVLVLERYSTYTSLHRFHKPVLVIHSSEDEVCPFRMGQKNYRHANDPRSFYEIKNKHIYGPIYYADSISYKMEHLIN